MNSFTAQYFFSGKTKSKKTQEKAIDLGNGKY